MWYKYDNIGVCNGNTNIIIVIKNNGVVWYILFSSYLYSPPAKWGRTKAPDSLGIKPFLVTNHDIGSTLSLFYHYLIRYSFFQLPFSPTREMGQDQGTLFSWNQANSAYKLWHWYANFTFFLTPIYTWSLYLFFLL